MSDYDPTLLEALGHHRPPWQADALCREYPDLPWFPNRGQPVDKALGVCGRCLVRAECLAWSMTDPDLDHGVLGGMTARARTNARRLDQQRKATL